MIIERNRAKKPQIDLQGPDGNVFVLLGYAKSFGRQLGLTKDGIEAIRNEMMSSDYDNAVATFDKHFGHVVDLVKPN